jgi:hypothetical protein
LGFGQIQKFLDPSHIPCSHTLNTHTIIIAPHTIIITPRLLSNIASSSSCAVFHCFFFFFLSFALPMGDVVDQCRRAHSRAAFRMDGDIIINTPIFWTYQKAPSNQMRIGLLPKSKKLVEVSQPAMNASVFLEYQTSNYVRLTQHMDRSFFFMNSTQCAYQSKKKRKQHRAGKNFICKILAP